MSQLRRFLREHKPTPPDDPVVRFETAPGEQMQVDWVEFRKGAHPLHAFCATLGFSRASYVEFVTDMKVGTLIDCHQKAFVALGGVPRRILYDAPHRSGSPLRVIEMSPSTGSPLGGYPERRHSDVDGLSPVQFEQHYFSRPESFY